MKIGILGGTFNPPHIGHLVIAEGVRQIRKLDKVFFIPANTPPHKCNDSVCADARLEMTRAAIFGNPFFEALDVEIEREGVSYTVDTLEKLKNDLPKDDLFLIIGSDLANDFSYWKDPHRIKSLAKILVVKRANFPLSYQDGSFTSIEVANIGVSSSQIRRMVGLGFSVRYLVPDAVARYIEEHGLYK